MFLEESMKDPSKPVSKPVEILHQDSWSVIVNKPAGLVVIPTPHKEEKTLTSIINEQFLLSKQGRLHPCHRLDRETSGVMIFAWGKKNQKYWMDAFQRRSVEKKYIALVQGFVKKPRGCLKSWVKDFDSRKYQKKEKPKWAEAFYEVLGHGKGFSVLKVDLLTGRTNQIRIQLAQIGHPVLGERKYAFAKDYPVKFRRVALHAQSVACTHPMTQKRINVEAPVPKDMSEYLNQTTLTQGKKDDT